MLISKRAHDLAHVKLVIDDQHLAGRDAGFKLLWYPSASATRSVHRQFYRAIQAHKLWRCAEAAPSNCGDRGKDSINHSARADLTLGGALRPFNDAINWPIAVRSSALALSPSLLRRHSTSSAVCAHSCCDQIAQFGAGQIAGKARPEIVHALRLAQKCVRSAGHRRAPAAAHAARSETASGRSFRRPRSSKPSAGNSPPGSVDAGGPGRPGLEVIADLGHRRLRQPAIGGDLAAIDRSAAAPRDAARRAPAHNRG